MKWGVRRTPEQLGHKNLKRAKTANLDKWGKDKDHNILYITGASGSGKSTVASTIGKETNSQTIHLDSYFGNAIESQNNHFNSYLDKKLPKWRRLKDETVDGSRDQWWRLVDNFAKTINDYGKDSYGKQKVIVEGIELMGEYLYEDGGKALQGKPVIVTTTPRIVSEIRGMIRDNAMSIPMAIGFIQNYSLVNKQIKDVVNSTNAKKGQEWVKEYLRGRQ